MADHPPITIVLEGLDRTGKTTTAQELGNVTKAAVTHRSKPDADPLDEYVLPLQGPPEARVFDRYHMGELVWPTIFDRHSTFDDVQFTYVEMVLESRGGINVIMRRDLDEVREAVLEDEEPLLPQDVTDAARLFQTAKQHTICPTLDHELGSLKSYDEVLRRARQRAKQAAWPHEVMDRWVGSLSPDILLVGEQVNDPDDVYTLPFVPHKTTSGYFLLKELIAAGLHKRVAFVNAHSPDEGPEPITELYEALGYPRVVALGGAADRALKDFDLDYEVVHHPQYVRRFLRKKGPGWYGRQITKAAWLA